ncbi:hypothetical protein GCM10010168_59550 [Actinoplanes ianthinogenes]|uniref:hypothetical protein n=1 Tax=Actinoplanes ianthinogenes TaxID=122358 RepID=UPI00198E1416|nr:hypothetical protein [Actinoplanes ianthinogenes]GGR33459.1 hypothetical protein GCM10010168_59550 [Actinoplanes ianthinogenes]
MSSIRGRAAAAAAAALTAGALLGAPAEAATSAFGPSAPQNPYTAPAGGATTHGDSASAKTFTGPGFAGSSVKVSRSTLLAACPTLLHGADGALLGLCTEYLGQAPSLKLLDKSSGAAVASLPITKGALLGGVYAYLDDQDRVVIVDGNRDLLRIAHTATSLTVTEKTPLAAVIADGDAVVGVIPAYDGRVWFVTAAGTVGAVNPGTGAATTYQLPVGEKVANSVSTVPGRFAVTSDHALYVFDTTAAAPKLLWRYAYDRGPARKPGQLSWGSGATPVFFGPATGYEYVAITDNADPHMNLVVLRTDGTGTPLCVQPLFTGEAASGTENAPVAAGRSIFITNTYGYDYPALPDDAGESVPSDAGFDGGVARIDVNAAGTGCAITWSTTTRSAALPRLSVTDGKLYTVVQDGLLNGFYAAAIDATTGAVSDKALLGYGLVNPLQTAGTPIGRTYYQGTVTGVLTIRPN